MEHNEAHTKTQHGTRDERVAALAYEIWEHEGFPDGKAEDHWFLACDIVDAEDQGVELRELPPWLSRAEVVVMETESKPTGKTATILKHKSAA